MLVEKRSCDVLTKTLSEGLERYQIGPRLRALRLKKKMGLVQLAEHTGLSPAMLSKVERGKLFPTLPTLLRMALVFGVGLEHFFMTQDEPQPMVVRKEERVRFPSHPDVKRPSYFFESLDFPATDRPMSAYLVEFEPVTAEDAIPHQHPGAEVIYLIEGRLTVAVAGSEHTLNAGDSLYMRGDRPHAYRRIGAKRCTGIVVTAA